MLRKVRLYGELAKFVGHRVLEADVSNAAQAIRFLIVNWPELEHHMADRYYKVLVEDWQLSTNELHYPTGQVETIKIVPVVGGAGGNGGFGSILMGAALIGASFLFPGAGMFGVVGVGGTGVVGGAGYTGLAATGWTAVGVGTAVGTAVSVVGAAMVLGGISQMLTPVPEVPEVGQDPRVGDSCSFSGIQNTSRAGVPVPIVYGEVITGSVAISIGVDTVQVEA